MKYAEAATRTLGALVLLACSACGGENGAPGVEDAGPDAGDVDGGPDADAGELLGPAVVGQLVDQDGQARGRVRVMACLATVCLFGEADADGYFRFEFEPPVVGAIKTPELASEWPRKAAAFEPFAIVDDSLVDLGTVFVPDLPEGATLGPERDDPQTLTVGDGLELTLRRADLTAPIGQSLYDVAACAIPEEHVPDYAALDDEEVIAVYALHPYGTASASPIGVRVPSAVPADTTVRFRTISEIDGAFSDPLPGRSDGTSVAIDAPLGIDRMTYLVVSRP